MQVYYSTTYSSPIGTLMLGSDEKKLIGLWIKNQKYHGSTIFKNMQTKNDLPIFETTKKWLDRYFAGKKPAISELSIAPEGSEFRKEVWKILCKIPYGETTSYGAIAKEIATKMNKKNMASQAVGGAVGHNPISIIIPCHRVVGTNNSLTGYASGLDIKIKLLELEGVDMSALFVPAKGTAL